ncbi:MAG: patatin-like phospholipase family protein [Bacilli bacterium]|nr:patatin-like phospholipase family protein [Bacilli bacterium]
MEKLGLVLSGGGSKGAYEIGVYKALKRLHIKPKVVTGTSIGAVCGVFVTQKDLRGALKYWKKLSFSTMYREEDFPKIEDQNLAKVYKQYIKAFLNDGGLDTSKMKDMFDLYFKPRKFFKSDIDYGLVTYNLSKRKPVFMTKKDLTKDNTKDYVLASASCYPAFKPYIINDELFVDGGYHDNLPINLAIDLGATKIIAVDLRAVGFKTKVKDESVEITYIAPKNKLASFLVFGKNKAYENIKYGYNDTMKTFGKLDGDIFTFKKRNLIKNYNKYNDLYEEYLNEIFDESNSKIINKLFNSPLFKEILNRKTLYKNFNKIVEKAGKIFKFEESNIYDIYSYNKGLLKEISNTEAIDIEKIIKKIKDKNIKNMFDERQITKYFYNGINNNNKSIIKYIPVFEDEFLSALYIYTIKGYNTIY